MKSREVIEAAAERSRIGFRDRLDRLRALSRPLLQASLAAALAWAIAVELVGHDRPFFAPVGAIITLGLTFGERGRRAVELAIGVSLGIVVGDLLVLGIGTGPWQIALVTSLAMAAAILLGGSALLVQQAAVSAVLVATLQPPTDGVSFARSVDALVGCGVALAMSFLVLPVEPLRLMRRESEPVLRELAGVLRDIAGALERGRREDAVAALWRARRIDVHAQRFAEALDVGRQMAVHAPTRRRERGTLELYADAGGQLDLAVRNVRVLARGVIRAIDVGDHVPPDVPEALRELGDAVASFGPWLEDPTRAAAAREPAVRAAHRASMVLEQTTNLSVSVIVGQIRSTAVDLLRGTGVEVDEARAMVRAGDGPG